MGRMKQLTPRVGPLHVRAPRNAPRLRDRVDSWRRWYKTQGWRDLRWDVLVAAGFRCARCELVCLSANLVADHIQPHRGDEARFWDRGNLQCLCKRCHDSDKQREERAAAGF
ncbi:MAG: HNH endonuclease signature motif containing protein [Paracoccus sp. (in: a-proteobacteria)]|nr:HNH endonuclease signature motif containing protein [Paracoccus sp. (in: a-proteobacteria)]